MKKLLFFLAVSLLTVSSSFAQYRKGTIDANLGLGLGDFPTLVGAVDFGLGKHISLGARGYLNVPSEVLGLGLRSAYHHQFVDNLDTYAGLTLDLVPGTDLSLLLGGRYFFQKRVAGFLELDLGQGGIGGSVGVTFKLQ
ncbi:MAG: hypothetical protein HC842_06370 [Cytophagales bacterium]|nr:hypothetical protein [Cytophagales bacterium]